jgi:hypothetical protein
MTRLTRRTQPLAAAGAVVSLHSASASQATPEPVRDDAVRAKMHTLLYGVILDQEIAESTELIDPDADASDIVIQLAALVENLHRKDQNTLLLPKTISVDGTIGIALADIAYDDRTPVRFLFVAIEVNPESGLLQRLWWSLNAYDED